MKRIFSEEDRRAIYLEITKDGEKVLMSAHIKGQELRKRLFQVLTPKEQTQLLKIYQKLSKAITQDY